MKKILTIRSISTLIVILLTVILLNAHASTAAEPLESVYPNNIVYQISSADPDWPYNNTLFFNGASVKRYYWPDSLGPNKGGVFTIDDHDYVISSDSSTSYKISSAELNHYIPETLLDGATAEHAFYSVKIYPFVEPSAVQY